MRDMDERPLHEQVEALKDDPAAWGDAVPPSERKSKSERRQRGAVVSVRLSAEELQALQVYADEEGKAISSVMRERALDAARKSDGSEVHDPEVHYLHPRRKRSTMTYTAQDGAPLVPANSVGAVAQ